MKLKFLNSAITGLILSLSCLVSSANAGIIGNLSHNTGDAYVTDSLNDLEWMHFDAAGSNGSVANLLASFADSNSELYGFTLSGTTHADLFLDAAFGSQTYSTSAAGFSIMESGIDASSFLDTMGDGFSNMNNVWKYFVADDVTSGSIHIDWTLGQDSNNANVNHTGNASTNPDNWLNDMSWLAYRPSVERPPAVPDEIPEPTTIAIFALGIFALTSRRLKK
jgi:hypothetical protein